ncbi:protein kinase [Streptomyces sp. NPDC052051]|uniref:protein kinase n=1 Tax=Streptomyces sp. NPDC052051 TaxID=3154649 RepID=UPI003443ED4E
MDDYAGRVLADRYRLPLPPSDAFELAETRAFDSYSGQEVLVRQVPLPEIVEAEVLGADGLPEGFVPQDGRAPGAFARSAATRRPTDPAVRRAIEAAQAAAQVPDHALLDQVFDVFAEAGSLWIVSELVPARPLAALLAEQPLTPYRAAEVASDVLTALCVLHAHGWVHRNVTARTVLVCDDGRVMLTGLAAGAAEEALCGYDPVPVPEFDTGTEPPEPSGAPHGIDAEAARRAAIEARGGGAPSTAAALGPGALGSAGDVRAARAGAIAAYRAGARAAAQAQDEQRGGPAALSPPGPADSGAALPAQTSGPGAEALAKPPPGQIVDPYGVGDTASMPVPGPAEPLHEEPAPEVPDSHGPGPWGHRGPATALAAERARQARMAVVGPVTERWAPEQAGPVHENWQLAPPIGPATDLWALGALLFRAVQGHAPYPEDSTTELVQLVCAEPPAYAEECGPLRPVVESLLRQDPDERPDVEELRGWLRSLIRSAPEPEAGQQVVPAPPADPTRLPIVRRRGELVRRRRARSETGPARHRRAREERQRPPRWLGRTLILLVLTGMTAAITFALVYLPKAASGGGDTAEERTSAAGDVSPAPQQSEPGDAQEPSPATSKSPTESAGSAQTQTNDLQVAEGFTLRKDPEGFRVAVANGWTRTPKNGSGQIVYSHGDFQLIVVPGRDSTKRYSSDPLIYQRESEPELQPFRSSSWASSSGMRRIDVGERTQAEGQFTWTDASGRALFVRNLAVLVGGHYHVVQIRGPEAERDEVTRLYEQAEQTYQASR